MNEMELIVLSDFVGIVNSRKVISDPSFRMGEVI